MKEKELNGKYAYWNDWGRLCKCGHKLGDHVGINDTGKRPCLECSECKHFQPKKKKK